MRDRAAYLLEGSPGPMPSALLARELLGIAGGSSAACDALLTPVLATDPRFEQAGAGAWRLSEEPSPYAAPSPPRDWTWAVWSVGPEARAAAVVRLESGRVVEERFEAAPAAPLTDRLDRPAVERLAEAARGALWASTEPSALFATLDRALREIDPGGVESRAFTLARLVTAAHGLPRPRSLEEVASRIGHRIVDSDDPLERARQGAECLLLLLDHPAFADTQDAADLEVRLRPSPAAPSLEGRDFDAAFLRSLPSEPGIYRFFDRGGELLYVGKARNLRVRVGSYFGARSRPDPRTESWLPHVHRIETERSGSELEALLREADLIARSLPPRNIQRTVHDRGPAATGHLVLLLPAPRGGAIRAHLIESGRLVARVLLGPRGAGRGRLRALLETIYFSVPVSPRRAQRRLSGNPHALISSWLKRQAGVVPAFDPTDSAGPEEALDLAIRHADDLRRGEWNVIHR